VSDLPTIPFLVLVTGLPGTDKTTMADVAAAELRAPVLGHDWAMSGLRPIRRSRTRWT
jgi:predicted kinase